MAEPLLVVDVQNGFLNDYTSHIPRRISHLIAQGGFAPILFTRFVNTDGSPYKVFLGWDELEDAPEVEIAPDLLEQARAGRVFDKHGYAGIPDDLAAYVREQQFAEVTVAGIDTDMCVLKVAMDLFDLGVRPIVLTDCCASTAGLQAHLAGLAVLARNIGADQLRDAGLNEGMLGAPRHRTGVGAGEQAT